MSVLAKIMIGTGVVIFGVSVLGLVVSEGAGRARAEREKITAENDAKERACELADDQYKSVTVCIDSKQMCFYGPKDLYEARQSWKFMQESCK